MHDPLFRSVPSRWQGAILVCGKCSKRVGGGFGAKGKTPLAKLLRRLGIGGKGRKAERGLVETGCLKLCPKRAVVAIDLARPDRWLLVPVGVEAETLREAFAPPALPSLPSLPSLPGDPA